MKGRWGLWIRTDLIYSKEVIRSAEPDSWTELSRLFLEMWPGEMDDATCRNI